MDRQMRDDRAFKQTTHKTISKRCFPKDPSDPSSGLRSSMSPLVRAARASMMVIGLIRMVKFLMAMSRRIRWCINGHLIVVDIPSVVSQPDQAAFPSYPYSQKGC